MNARRAAWLLIVLAAACRDRETPAPEFAEPVRVSDGAPGTGQSEPSIAVTGDGGTLLAGWIDWAGAVPVVRLARSTNGGATFAASRRIEENDAAHPHGQAEATLAFDGGRRFAFGWIGCRPDPDSLENHACDVYARLSDDAGITWSSRITIAEGGPARRDRPWMFVEDGRFAVAWSEVGPGGSRWMLARERTAGAFAVDATLDGRAAVQPPSSGPGGLEALLIDRATRDPRLVMLEARRIGEAEPSARWSFQPEAVLLPYSLGAFVTRADGDAWIAIPEGDGNDGDLSLLHRSPGGAFRAIRRLRSPGATRVGLPWIAPFGSNRFLAAWVDESGAEGWRVRARVLGPGAATSAPADLSRSPFRFHEASRTLNIGDFLSVASAGDEFWVAWSDTRAGDADVWLARGKTR